MFVISFDSLLLENRICLIWWPWAEPRDLSMIHHTSWKLHVIQTTNKFKIKTGWKLCIHSPFLNTSAVTIFICNFVVVIFHVYGYHQNPLKWDSNHHIAPHSHLLIYNADLDNYCSFRFVNIIHLLMQH